MTIPPTRLSDVASVLRSADLLSEVSGPEDAAVRGVAQDSRQVRAGDLFLAWRGVDADGHDYVPEAVAAGAAALVVERPLPEVALPQLVVRDGRRAGALVADLILRSPWRDLALVGVTGTNGKTTTALLVRHLMSGRGPAAAIGTLGVIGPDGRVREGTEGLTTPGPVQLSTWLRELADQGTRTVVLEASSHALAQARLDGLRFDVGVFTNLSRDHFDYHGDLADYRRAKRHLAELLGDGGVAVVRSGDEAWQDLEATSILSFGIEAGDLRARDVAVGPAGSSFRMSHGSDDVEVRLPLVGHYNVENALAAAGVALSLGQPLEWVAERLGAVPQIPGRLEVVVREPFAVVIDFAHTPDALENVLSTLRPLAPSRLVVLFGAGGDRDGTKRLPMADTVARWADQAWLTSDNPRTEDPDAILDDLEPGLSAIPYRREVDRRSAIHAAVGEAVPGDLLLLAGKGHERYQVIGTERLPFDERLVVREAMAARGAA